MSVNSLIAQGGTGRSPVQSFIRGSQQGQNLNVNNLAMQSTKQRMGINQENQEVAKQQRQIKGIASLAKHLDSLPDAQREEAFNKAVAKMPQMGLEPPPFGSTYASMKPQLEMVKMQVFGEQEKWTQGQSASGTPVQTSTVSGKQIAGFEPDPTTMYGANRPTAADPNRYGQPPINPKGDVVPGAWKNMYNQKQNVVTDDIDGWNTKGAADKEKAYAIKMRENVYQLHSAVDSIVKDIESSTHYVGGASGSIVKMINSASQQFNQLRNKPDDLMTDGKFNLDKLGKISKENASWLRKAAMETGTMDSAVLELAFTHAKYLNNSGKISDADIRAAREIIDEPDRAIAAQKLNELKQRATDNYYAAKKARKKNDSYGEWHDLELDSGSKTGDFIPQNDNSFIDNLMGVP